MSSTGGVMAGGVATGGLTSASGALVDVGSDATRVALVVVVIGAIGLAALVNAVGGLGMSWAVVRAGSRAVVQLLVVALVVGGVLGSLPLTLLFLAFMGTVASATAARRLTRRRDGAWTAVPVLVGAVPVLAGLVAVGLVPAEGIALVPIGGILIGNAMTATVLAGRRTLDALGTRRGEVEAALAIGLLPRDAALLIARPDASLALLPGLDQTRTVGLVTLPGAFVGMLLGGATPAAAAAVQLVVLVSLLLVQSLAVLVTLELVARAKIGTDHR